MGDRIEPPVDSVQDRWREDYNRETRRGRAIDPPIDSAGDAIAEMWRAVNALRLEVPRAVADDVEARWRAVLEAIGQ